MEQGLGEDTQQYRRLLEVTQPFSGHAQPRTRCPAPQGEVNKARSRLSCWIWGCLCCLASGLPQSIMLFCQPPDMGHENGFVQVVTLRFQALAPFKMSQ